MYEYYILVFPSYFKVHPIAVALYLQSCSTCTYYYSDYNNCVCNNPEPIPLNL